MKVEKYNEATEILKRIEHVDKVLEFINGIKKSGLSIAMWESGFVAHPERVILEQWQYDRLVETYEGIKNELKQKLEEL